MARPREFDRADALNKAMAVFWMKGYAATSTADLLQAMQIGRQSMYDTFGGKHALYLETLRHYGATSVGELLRSLQGETALDGLANMLYTFAARPAGDKEKGCMGVNAICEFGQSDADVNAARDASGELLCKAIGRVLCDAVAEGEMAAGSDIAQAAAFVAATLSGMKVSAKAGATPETLRAIAAMAVKALRK